MLVKLSTNFLNQFGYEFLDTAMDRIIASEPVNRNDSVAVARIRHALVGDQVQNEKGRRHCGPNCCNIGTPCRTQTCDLLIRSQTLYSTELRVHAREILLSAVRFCKRLSCGC